MIRCGISECDESDASALATREGLAAGVEPTRAAILEVVAGVASMLANPAHARIVAEPSASLNMKDPTDSQDSLVDSISQQVHVLQAQVQHYWKRIG